eukprot:6206578-Pleurochrysis_carterae.AAC.5
MWIDSPSPAVEAVAWEATELHLTLASHLDPPPQVITLTPPSSSISLHDANQSARVGSVTVKKRVADQALYEPRGAKTQRYLVVRSRVRVASAGPGWHQQPIVAALLICAGSACSHLEQHLC